MDIKTLQKESHRIAVEHGFFDGQENDEARANPYIVSTKLMLIVSELAEAMEDVRDGNWDINLLDHPTGFPIELADVMIRLTNLAEWMEIDLEEAIQIKQAYNETRPRKHGKII